MTDTAHALLVATLTNETALRHAAQARDAAGNARRALDAARVAHATANPHPWLGRKVKRSAKRSSYSNGLTTQRGIVKMRGINQYNNWRNHTPAMGETFVETMGGATAYKFEGDDRWELDA